MAPPPVARWRRSLKCQCNDSVTTECLCAGRYDFAGWNTVADGSGTGYAEKASLTMGGSNLTLYAQWTPETVAFASANTISSSADNAKLIHTVDIDGDGDMDVLSASYGDDTIAWYENNGSESFTERTIDSGANGAWSVSGVDVDGDGDVDVLAASYDDDTVAWYENNGSESFTKRTVTTAVNGPHVAYATDVDGDGDVDILSASNEDDTIAWFENDGSQGFTKRVVTTTADGAMAVYALDVDGDGDVDILSHRQMMIPLRGMRTMEPSPLPSAPSRPPSMVPILFTRWIWTAMVTSMFSPCRRRRVPLPGMKTMDLRASPPEVLIRA